jgi:(1->4)-alpha-D-glucan 1-alpha-D-glucosylmutase
MPDRPPNVPVATYRLQLHPGFTLDHAREVVPYLAALGISHLYLSPVLQAAPGSTHGYDVVDHSRVNRELGGDAAFDRLTDALRAHGMGLVLDVVPNHMAIGEENRWWWDVLRHGPSSAYAHFFDVDWDPPESRLRNVVLLPILADHYGRVLEAGQIRVVRRDGALLVEASERSLPVDPQTLGPLLGRAADAAESDELAFIASALSDLPSSTDPDPDQAARRQRDADVLEGRLAELVADAAVATALDRAVDRLNGDVEALDAFLEQQNYRLALWRAASRDLGYRRFFDIDELIGLRQEDERVFAATHERILGWVREGRVHGLRIDHPDGLRDPAGYVARLRAAAPDAWIVAEKILEPGESLPAEWPIDGTTGYRFANLATGVLVDPAGEPALTARWAEVADTGPGWEEIVDASRMEVLSAVLGSDVNRLTELLLAVCEANRRYRDFTRHEVHEALRQVAAAMPVYRTYVRARDRHVSPVDARLIATAVETAVSRRPDLDPELFAFLGRVLRLEEPGPLAAELAMRFQQLTPAAMAKGVEDTAFYRHHRLVALNEVGGDPGHFGTSLEELHRALADIGADWPSAMLALSTHDTKRSADVRARLALLSQDPAWWTDAAARLRRAAEPHRTDRMPSEADAYLFLQTVIGAWPIDADRAAGYLAKAAKEAKLRTTWTDPHPAYDAALEAFVRGTLADERFVAAVEEAVDHLRRAAWRGSLVQLALQLTAPGVPDVYQGGELWDLSLVDPDNRRPVDFVRRRRLLDEVAGFPAAQAWQRAEEGVPKLWLLYRLLRLRAERPASFAADAGYEPIAVDGDGVAFRRGDVLAVVPRLVLRAPDGALQLPDGDWRGLDGRPHGGRVTMQELLAEFPVAVLERTS